MAIDKPSATPQGNYGFSSIAPAPQNWSRIGVQPATPTTPPAPPL